MMSHTPISKSLLDSSTWIYQHFKFKEFKTKLIFPPTEVLALYFLSLQMAPSSQKWQFLSHPCLYPYTAVHKVLTCLPAHMISWHSCDGSLCWCRPLSYLDKRITVTSLLVSQFLLFSLHQLTSANRPSSNITFPYIPSYVSIHLYFWCLLYTRCWELKREAIPSRYPLGRVISDTFHSMLFAFL